jgi:hypothetical protein
MPDEVIVLEAAFEPLLHPALAGIAALVDVCQALRKGRRDSVNRRRARARPASVASAP